MHLKRIGFKARLLASCIATFPVLARGSLSPTECPTISATATPTATPSPILSPSPSFTITPDIILIKAASPLVLWPWETLTYTISYSNSVSSYAVPSFQVWDSLPTPGALYLSSSPAGTLNGSLLNWDLGPLAAGQSGSVTVRLQLAPGLLTEDEGYLTPGAFNLSFYSESLAIRFQLPQAEVLSSVELWIGTVTAPVTVRVELRTDDGSGQPSTVMLASGALAAPTPFTMNTIDISDTALAKGRTYHLVLLHPDFGSFTIAGVNRFPEELSGWNHRILYGPPWDLDTHLRTVYSLHFSDGNRFGQTTSSIGGNVVAGVTELGETIVAESDQVWNRVEGWMFALGSPPPLRVEVRDASNAVLADATNSAVPVSVNGWWGGDLNQAVTLLAGNTYRLMFFTEGHLGDAANYYGLQTVDSWGSGNNGLSYGGVHKIASRSFDGGLTYLDQPYTDAVVRINGNYLRNWAAVEQKDSNEALVLVRSTWTITNTATSTITPTASPSPSWTPSTTLTATPSATATPSPTLTETESPTISDTFTVTLTTTPSPSPTPTALGLPSSSDNEVLVIPNPVLGSSARFRVQGPALEAGSRVLIRLYSVSGEMLGRLSAASGGNRHADLFWEARDPGGKLLAAGLYLAIVEVHDSSGGTSWNTLIRFVIMN